MRLKAIEASLLRPLAGVVVGAMMGLCSVDVYAAETNKLVRVAVYDFKKLCRLDGKGHPVSGYAYDYIRAIAKEAGWKIDYVPCSGFSEGLSLVITGAVDLFYDVSYTQKREKWILFPDEPMGREIYYLYAHGDRFKSEYGDLQPLAGKVVGVTKGTIEVDMLRDWAARKSVPMNIVEFDEVSVKERTLEAGGVDLDLETNVLADPRLSIVARIGTSDYYLVTNRDRPDLLSDLNAAQVRILARDPYHFQRMEERHFSQISTVGDFIRMHPFVVLLTAGVVTLVLLSGIVALRRKGDSLESALATKTRFISEVSHDIRTPLNAIIGFSDLLKKGDQNAVERQKTLEAISSSGYDLLKVVNDRLSIKVDEALASNDGNFKLVSSRRPSLRVLVVDDIAMNLKVIQAMLRKLGVVDIVSAENGEEALKIFESDEKGFDLVLTDIWMPGLDGNGLVREIRRQENGERLPVYAVTADVGAERTYEKDGFTGLILKPVTLDKLTAPVDAVSNGTLEVVSK